MLRRQPCIEEWEKRRQRGRAWWGLRTHLLERLLELSLLLLVRLLRPSPQLLELVSLLSV